MPLVRANAPSIIRTFASAPDTPDSTRTGGLAMKVGMMPMWDAWGVRHAVTVLQMDACQVTQIKTQETDGYTAVQLGVGEAKWVNKPQRGHYETANVVPKRKVWEFRVTEDALLPVGTQLVAQHFVPGQKLDICGISNGKGFAGGMKRHNFGGLRASHGVSAAHRSLGSTGNCQDPGRVWKGKKMPGRMGGDRITTRNLWLYKIDTARNLLYVKGAVPGRNGGFVRVADARDEKWKKVDAPPFPTYLPDPEVEVPLELFAPAETTDPLNYHL